MGHNVFLISLTGILVVFLILFLLFIILKLFKYISQTERETKKKAGIKDYKTDLKIVKSDSEAVTEREIAVIFSLLVDRKHLEI